MCVSLTLDEGFPATVLERLVTERAVEPDLAPPGTVLPPLTSAHISKHIYAHTLCSKHNALRSNATPTASHTHSVGSRTSQLHAMCQLV